MPEKIPEGQAQQSHPVRVLVAEDDPAGRELLLALLEAELPPTLGHMRDLTAKLDELADELPPRLQHLDALLDEGDETLAALRSSAEATEQVVRVPLDAMKRVRRGLRIGGSGGRQRPDASGAGTARERERA